MIPFDWLPYLHFCLCESGVNRVCFFVSVFKRFDNFDMGCFEFFVTVMGVHWLLIPPLPLVLWLCMMLINLWWLKQLSVTEQPKEIDFIISLRKNLYGNLNSKFILIENLHIIFVICSTVHFKFMIFEENLLLISNLVLNW